GRYSYPGLATIVDRRNERVPFARKLTRLIIARNVCADKTNGRSSGTSADRFDLSGVNNAVINSTSCSKIDIVTPGNSVIGIAMTYLNVRVTFRRSISSHWLIVNVGVINRAV